MPEGFEPHREIQRIYNVRDLIAYFRSDARVADMQEVWRNCLHDESPYIRMDALKLGLAYGFGKPTQTVHVAVDSDQTPQQRRVVVLPDNHRKDMARGPVIDAES